MPALQKPKDAPRFQKAAADARDHGVAFGKKARAECRAKGQIAITANLDGRKATTSAATQSACTPAPLSPRSRERCASACSPASHDRRAKPSAS
eukprot:scaffold24168_cov63-Phaeocystis_antarctica.AAC.4